MVERGEKQTKSVQVTMPITQAETQAHTLIGANYNHLDVKGRPTTPTALGKDHLEKGDEITQVGGR